MTRLREQIRTSLGPEAAFAYVADFANSTHWDPGVATSRRIDDGQVGVGARFELGVRLGGRVALMEYGISAFEPSARVVLVGEGSGISAVDEIRFCAGRGGPLIDYTADIRLRWRVAARPAVPRPGVRQGRSRRPDGDAAHARCTRGRPKGQLGKDRI